MLSLHGEPDVDIVINILSKGLQRCIYLSVHVPLTFLQYFYLRRPTCLHPSRNPHRRRNFHRLQDTKRNFRFSVETMRVDNLLHTPVEVFVSHFDDQIIGARPTQCNDGVSPFLFAKYLALSSVPVLVRSSTSKVSTSTLVSTCSKHSQDHSPHLRHSLGWLS